MDPKIDNMPFTEEWRKDLLFLVTRGSSVQGGRAINNAGREVYACETHKDAVIVLNVAKEAYRLGVQSGKEQMQAEIRKIFGLDPVPPGV